MSNERGSIDANQIKQASNQPRGAAGDTPQPVTYAYIIDRDGQWWQLWGADQQLPVEHHLGLGESGYPGRG